MVKKENLGDYYVIERDDQRQVLAVERHIKRMKIGGLYRKPGEVPGNVRKAEVTELAGL